jgi:MoxR-like ATPase
MGEHVEQQEVNELVYTKAADEFVDDKDGWAKARDRRGDRRDGTVYRMDPRLRLAVDLALVTGRPLLVRGEPGSGKSSLAPYLARNLKARYYEEVVTGATRIEDFLWRFDTVRKLSDAQARQQGSKAPGDESYIVPGVLWKAFNSDGQFSEGGKPDAVVLVDEIDKADPDVPNGLLVPIGSGRFHGPMISQWIEIPESHRVFVVITTNEERQLPPAFLRRCVVVQIPPPTKASLVEIATLHFAGPGSGEPAEDDAALFGALAEKLLDLRRTITKRERPPGIAEYLDAVRACKDLNLDPRVESPAWRAVEEFTLRKPTDTD